MMKEQDKNYHQREMKRRGERGISIVEILIVALMISIVATFAAMQIGAAQRAMRLTNSAREFLGWLEKARLDSLRRHAMSSVEMASITLNNNNTYTVTIDQNGDGTLDPGRTITIPNTHGARFSGVTIPSTIYYNWRGRPVDSAGNSINLSFNLIDSAGNVNQINLSGGGDATLGTSANISSVSVSNVSTNANIKAKTY
jgi:type II secretory pathway pseudopilin PulG